MGLFDSLDSLTDSSERIVRAPFPYPGSKKGYTKLILPHLPYKKSYIEPFGGSGSVLLARNCVGLEVYNDRFGGVTEFYKCIRNKATLDRLIERLSLTICSKQEFYDCKQCTSSDPVERAAAWYYSMCYSFGGIGRNWGRSKGPVGILAGVIQQHIPEFRDLHRRLQHVQIENLDWHDCCVDYDSHEAVFYMDPPYLETDCHVYIEGSFSFRDHQSLCEWSMNAEGFVAISSYQNNLYDQYDWDQVIEFDRTDRMVSKGGNGANCKQDTFAERGTVTECLYIKE